jgi:hypothetical protein
VHAAATGGEPWVVGAPELVDAVGLARDGTDHLVVVARGQVVRDVEHDIGDDVADRGECVGSDIGEVVVDWVSSLVTVASVLERERQPPVDLYLLE